MKTDRTIQINATDTAFLSAISPFVALARPFRVLLSFPQRVWSLWRLALGSEACPVQIELPLPSDLGATEVFGVLVTRDEVLGATCGAEGGRTAAADAILADLNHHGALTANHHVLPISIDQMVVDDWSQKILAGELSELAAAASDRHRLPYAGHMIWIAGKSVGRQTGYKLRMTSGTSKLLQLPTNRPPPVRQDYRSCQFALHGDLAAQLKT
ncbi:hypothetical protein AB0V79_32965 [Mesorhizobium ciceri]|uniref:hypothetical protein n=1 Tax=Mesorhizobium TaxID=68287 RepID=UPI000AEF7AB8|nr:hypothetical protein [Mesorhizobium ciceri]